MLPKSSRSVTNGESLPNPGCLGCRDRRGRVAVVESQRQADDSITLLQPLPPDCAVCGRRPEFVIEMVRPHMPLATGTSTAPL
jgi:hypothetical protein